MSAAADGDRAAIDPLFQALWPALTGYATRFLGDRALAEDTAQDAIIKLFGQLDRYDRERDALTWALSHTTWACRTLRRRAQRRAEDSRVPDRAAEPVGFEERDLVRAALEAVSTLPARDIEILAAALSDD